MQSEELRLDGNAAAGALRELFTRDVTSATGTCAQCGTSAQLGSLPEYGHSMGIVLRCITCDATVLRLVRTPGHFHVDFSGLSFFTIPE